MEKTTALIKRFRESFLAGEICECKRSDHIFVFCAAKLKRASAEQISKILPQAKAYSSPSFSAKEKQQTFLSVAFSFTKRDENPWKRRQRPKKAHLPKGAGFFNRLRLKKTGGFFYRLPAEFNGIGFLSLPHLR